MTAKEYLGQAYWLDQRINSKLNMVVSLRETATKTTSVMHDDVVSHSRNVHSMQDVIVKIIEIERELDDDIDRLIDLKHEIIDVIGQISDPPAQVVLEYRYVCYRQWKDIAAELGMHVRNVYRLHERGLQEAEKILKKNPPKDTMPTAKAPWGAASSRWKEARFCDPDPAGLSAVPLCAVRADRGYADRAVLLAAGRDAGAEALLLHRRRPLPRGLRGHGHTKQEYFATLIADAAACCSQGIEFVWAGEHVYPRDYPPLETEITVTGIFDTYYEGEYMYVQLKDAQVEWDV